MASGPQMQAAANHIGDEQYDFSRRQNSKKFSGRLPNVNFSWAVAEMS
jgi:hypothetical protein